MNKQELTDRDFSVLSASFISRDLATTAGIFRVDSHDGAEIVGRNGNADYAGIIFPYYLPGNSHPREYRLRRDTPDLEQGANGKIKQKAKYLSPPGKGNQLYFVPTTATEWLADTTLPVCITEGEKKTLALWEMAWHGLSDAALTPRFLPVGLSGAWNWRGKIGKTETDTGKRQDLKGVIPDFDLIAWKGRIAYIVYDTNVRTNESVQVARSRLAAELTRRGAEVRLIDLPETGGVNGVDDLLGLKGADYVWALFDSAKPAEERKSKSKSQASVLVGVTDEAELFHTSDGDAYATIPINGHHETWALKSRGFRDWLSKRYYEAERSIPNAQAMQDALNTLQGIARHEGQSFEIHTRLAAKDDCIWLDLCDEEWRVVRISAEGWEIVCEAPIKFRRTKGMRALPAPARGGSISQLRGLVNATDADWVLLISWLVAAFRPGYPFPVLVIHGEQGSAKSTVSKMLRELIDPNVAPLRSEQRDERDLMLAATNSWVVALDNLSKLPVWLSDALCRLSTGGGFATRTLYENDEETLFIAMRPIIINGIEELTTRSDLLDRSVIINLPAISPEKRRPESEVWPEFERVRPFVLGSLLDAVSYSMGNVGSVRLDQKPRMADFSLWATAAEESFGLERGAFISAFMGNRESANALALEASPIAATLVELVEQRGAWKGSASDLLEALNQRASDETKKQQGWPKRPNSLSGALKRIAPNLRAAGIECNMGRTKAGSFINLEYRGKSSSTPSPASPSAESAFTVESEDDGRGDDAEYDARS
jgi:hypothetical protein